MCFDAIGAWLFLIAFDFAPSAGDAGPGVEIWVRVGGGLGRLLDAIVGVVGCV